jgi:hypothetical protein
MSLILSGTDGLSDVDGTAATPAIRGTDANTGIFFPAADTIAFSEGGAEAMRIDSDGDVGIGTASPARTLHVKADGVTTLANSNGALFTDASNAGVLLGSDNILGYISGVTVAGTATVDLVLQPFGGNVLMATTNNTVNNSNSFVYRNDLGAEILNHINGTASGAQYIYFGYNGSVVGSVTQNGTTGVLYNLTSDYRLKNEQQPLTGAKDFIMALKPKKWQWWDGSGEGVGFVAHEFMEVAKHSGNGEKDAVDKDGKPVYQSIQPSSSEVMANLVSLIQEQQALITTLTARITALETK